MKFIKIITKKRYDFLLFQIRILKEENNELEKKLMETKKKLLYATTYQTTFENKLKEVIFPNSDERGLGEQETPIDFPDIW